MHSYQITFELIHLMPINETITGTTTQGQSELRSKDNEGVFHAPQCSRTRASPPDVVWRVLTSLQDAVNVCKLMY